MPLTILHSTAPDGTFSATGAQAWTAAHTVSGSLTEADISLSDTTTGNVSTSAHGFTPKAPNDSTKFLRGDATWAVPVGSASSVPDTGVVFSDTVAGNVSTSSHGFAPKVTNTANFLKGDGTWASPGSASGPTFPGGIPLTGVSYPRVKGDNLSTGNNDLYTVPSGKRLLVYNCSFFNTSAGNIVAYIALKTGGGTYLRLTSNTTASTGASTQFASIGYIFEAGETVAINTATNNGANVTARAVLFDNTCAVRSVMLTSLSAGDNTVYTVGGGTTAFLLNQDTQNFNTASTLLYVNASGGSRTVLWNVVDSGGSVATTNQVTASTSVGDVTRSSLLCAATLNAGDFVNINTDAATATQIAWVNVMEI